jgi:hypothetical protein
MDPLVNLTGQPYAFTGDDPLNGTDPLGAMFTCGGQPGACAGSPSTGPILIPPAATPPPSHKPSPTSQTTTRGPTYTPVGGESQSSYYAQHPTSGPPSSEQYYGNGGPAAPTPRQAKRINDDCSRIHGVLPAIGASGAVIGVATLSGLGAYGLGDLILNFTPLGIPADIATGGAAVFAFGGFLLGGLATGNALCSGNAIPDPIS